MGDELRLVSAVQENAAVGGGGVVHESGLALGAVEVRHHEVRGHKVVVCRHREHSLGRHVLRPQHQRMPQELAAEGLRHDTQLVGSISDDHMH